MNFTKVMEKIKSYCKVMKQPKGMTLELGFDKYYLPHLYLGPQRFGKIRPRTRERVGTYEDKIVIAEYGGFKFDFGFGTVRRPFSKMWKKEFWTRDYAIKNPATNPWNSGNHWFIMTIPWCPYVFVSCMLGRWGKNRNLPGFYIGGRTAVVNDWTHYLIKYNEKGELGTWVKDEDGNQVYAWGDASEDGNIYIEPTLAIRSDFIH